MQAATPPPDHVARFKISLDEIILAPIVTLTEQQQRRQMSKPFECHGMHWILTVEKEAPSDGGNGFNLFVVLYCLSIPVVTEDDRQEFSLKGTIVVDQLSQDGQTRSYNGKTGQCCNLVGKHFPAKAVLMEGFALSLCSGQTESEETEIVLNNSYYGEGWRGVGGVALRNHTFDPVRDGAAIEIRLWFLAQPRALQFVN